VGGAGGEQWCPELLYHSILKSLSAPQRKYLLCAFLFSSLLNLKHIYMYTAPAYFVFLLRAYVYPVGSTRTSLPAAIERLITLGAFTLAPFAISLLPLMLSGFQHEAGPLGVIGQMFSRLFPFSRGLNHAYWAPNFWSLWTALDRVLLQVVRRSPSVLRLLPARLQANFAKASGADFASASRGLIGNVEFALMPNISPRTCFFVTALSMLVPMTKLWFAPTYKSFVIALSLCAYASFLFGWHVHEKAILMVLLPLTYTAADDYLHFRSFMVLSVAGCFSLFPLLYQPAETPIKIIYTLLWLVIVLGALSQKVYRPVPSNLGLLMHAVESAYLAGFPLVLLYTSAVHPLLFPSAQLASTRIMTASDPVPTNAATLTAIAEDSDTPEPVLGGTTGVLLSVASSILPKLTEKLSIADPLTSAPNSQSSTSSLDFFPLMLTSVYCAVGVCWIGTKLTVLYLWRDFKAEAPSIAKKMQ
jgi:alpha-1,3-glucosyltransferase